MIVSQQLWLMKIHIWIDHYLPLLIILYLLYFMIIIIRSNNIDNPLKIVRSCQPKNRPNYKMSEPLGTCHRVVHCFGATWAPPRWSLHRCQLHRNRHPTLRERSGEVVSKRRFTEMLNGTCWDNVLEDLEDEMNEL